MQSLLQYLKKSRCIEIEGRTKDDVLHELAVAAINDDIREDAEDLCDELIERENIMSTGIGIGIAVPHTRCPNTDVFTLAVGRSKEGVHFDSLDGKPVFLFFLVVAPGNDHRKYLQILAKIVTALKDREFFQRLVDAPTPEDIYDYIEAYEK